MKTDSLEPPVFISKDEIDLRELFNMLWTSRWLIVGCTLFAGVLAACVSLMMPNIYQSQVLLAPVEETSSGGLAALAGQFGGLASLAGVKLNRGETSKTTIAIEVLKSRAFITDFVRRRNIAVHLMAGKKWDAEADKVILDPQKYDVVAEQWVIDETDPKSGPPTDWDIYKKFSSLISVQQDKASSLVTVTVNFISPSVAKLWVDWLVEDVNVQMRQRDVDEANRSIEFLKDQLNKTSIKEMQQIFYQLIEKQTQTIMLANVRDQYVFKVIDPPVVPQEKTNPKRALIVLLAMLATGMLSVMYVLVRNSLRSPERD